jgi:hypothetical protein
MFDLASQADVGSSGAGSGGQKYNATQQGAETFQMKIANNKVYTLFYLDKGLPYHTKLHFIMLPQVFGMCMGACLSILYQSTDCVV